VRALGRPVLEIDPDGRGVEDVPPPLVEGDEVPDRGPDAVELQRRALRVQGDAVQGDLQPLDAGQRDRAVPVEPDAEQQRGVAELGGLDQVSGEQDTPPGAAPGRSSARVALFLPRTSVEKQQKDERPGGAHRAHHRRL
jgi:hypothetical protein